MPLLSRLTDAVFKGMKLPAAKIGLAAKRKKKHL
jgi:hypothetical protein